MDINLTTKERKKLYAFLPFLLVFLGIFILFYLGLWQWNRGVEKERIAERIDVSTSASILLSSTGGDLKDYQFQMVEVHGSLQKATPILLDNRFFNSQVGYELFLVFSTSKGKNLLVNTGWLSKDDNIQEKVDRIGDPSNIEGVLYLPTKGFTIGGSYVGEVKWPLVVQYLDFPDLSTALGVDLSPVVIVADFSNDGLEKIWNPYVVTAERHYGYAVQWWGLTLVLIIFGLVWLRIRIVDKNKHTN